jgi:hypothetical protein
MTSKKIQAIKKIDEKIQSLLVSFGACLKSKRRIKAIRI